MDTQTRQPLTAEAATAMAATSTRDLLRKGFALTHQIHVADDLAKIARRNGHRSIELEQLARAEELRQMRDLITDEVDSRTAR